MFLMKTLKTNICKLIPAVSRKLILEKGTRGATTIEKGVRLGDKGYGISTIRAEGYAEASLEEYNGGR